MYFEEVSFDQELKSGCFAVEKNYFCCHVLESGCLFDFDFFFLKCATDQKKYTILRMLDGRIIHR